MKLIIDISENRFKDLQRIASIQMRRRSLTCEQIIANGTPLSEELEKIKEKIDIECDSVDSALDVILDRISELKGEQK